MGRVVIQYDDFSGGDHGLREEWKAPKNSFSATNMRVYSTGELGVRAGVKDITPTSGGANGVVQSLYAYKDGNNRFVSIHANQHRQFTLGGTTFTNTAGITADAVAYLATVNEDSVYAYVAADKPYLLAPGSVTGLTGAPTTGVLIAEFGDRLVLSIASSNTIRYSAAANYNSWPAANVLAIGDTNSEISGLVVQRGALIVFKPEGIFAVTGALGVNETLRKVSSAMGPSRVWFPTLSTAIVTPDDIAWFTPQAGGNSVAAWDGARVTPVRKIPDPIYQHAFPMTAREQRGVLLANNAGATAPTECWTYSEGAWTYHQLGINAAITNVNPSVASLAVGASLVNYPIDVLLFTDGGGASVQPKFYSWVSTLDRPGFESGGVLGERAGDLSTSAVSGSVTFPEWHTDDGSEVTVRSVIVDFRSWNTGASTTNHFDLVVNAVRLYDGSSPVASGTLSFDQAVASSSTSGTIQRRAFSVGDQGPAGGFQLAFTNIRGVAIQRITVIVDTSPPRFC